MKKENTNMSDEKFMNAYSELINKGYDLNSPEIVKLFKQRATFNQVNLINETHVRTRAKKSAENYSNSQETSELFKQRQSFNQVNLNNGTHVRTRAKKSAENYSNSQETSEFFKQRATFNQVNLNNGTHVRTRAKKSAENYSNSQETSELFKQRQSFNQVNNNNNGTHVRTRTKKSAEQSLNLNPPIDSKANFSHILIDPHKGNYYLFDSNFKIVDTSNYNKFFKFFLESHNLKKFKKQLNSDFKEYKKFCKQNKIKINSEFKKLNKKIKFYLWLCPDADYNILELLRKNITKINPAYSNYQSACAEYLHELAKFSDGDSENLCFDINFTVNDLIGNNHRFISNAIGKSTNPVESYVKSNSIDESAQFISDIHFDPIPKSDDFFNTRQIKTNNIYER